MTPHLIEEMHSIADFSEDDLELFERSLEEVEIAKGEHFLREGQISMHVGYMVSGLMMHYKIIDGIEVPADFTKETQWLAYMKSFTNGTPSEMAIKALEPSTLLVLSLSKMMELFKKQPNFIQLKSYHIEKSLFRNTEHAANLATLDAKQRYLKFVREYPDLVNRVPQYLIAAYLGIKPQSLSRLRK